MCYKTFFSVAVGCKYNSSYKTEGTHDYNRLRYWLPQFLIIFHKKKSLFIGNMSAT